MTDKTLMTAASQMQGRNKWTINYLFFTLTNRDKVHQNTFYFICMYTFQYKVLNNNKKQPLGNV